ERRFSAAPSPPARRSARVREETIACHEPAALLWIVVSRVPSELTSRMFLGRFLVTCAAQTFWAVYDGALFILIGFAVAGAVHVLLDPSRIVRYLGGRDLRSALIAALLGAPIPLCSCGVLPTAVSL